jgi:AbrB family looped-hinge helix DNA binding protein
MVVPKKIREKAGLRPGDPLEVRFLDGRIEIEPLPREVRIEERDGFVVAEAVGPYETLREETVRGTRRQIRAERKTR